MMPLLQYQLRIIALWTAFLLGLIFHTDLGLMPLFHGVDVASSHGHDTFPLSIIFWLMLLFFAIPMMAIALTPFLHHHRGNQLNFGLTVIYSILNLIHFGMDVLVKAPSYQLALMGMLVLIGFALNRVTFQWLKHHAPVVVYR
jgi:hypothetical protein